MTYPSTTRSTLFSPVAKIKLNSSMHKPIFAWYNDFIREEIIPYSSIHQPHDKGYKYLLSHTDNFVEFLRDFVGEEWVESIDVSQIERVDKSSLLPEFKAREADQLFRLILQNGREVLFFVLMEFQSRVDFLILFRLLTYMMGHWTQVVASAGSESETKHFSLPVIIPIVLYKGLAPWTAKRNFKEMLKGYEQFGTGLLDFTYHLIDVNRYSEQKLLAKGTLMSSVFYLDQKIDVKTLVERLHQLAPIIRQWDVHKFRMFTTWLNGIFMERLPVKERDVVTNILHESNPLETDTMISNLGNAITEALQKAEQDGMNQGWDKGRDEGKIEGKVSSILDLLEMHGVVDEDLRMNLMSQRDERTLTHWVRLAARVHSIDEFKVKMGSRG